MSSEGPPPVFDDRDFSYWKIRIEAYVDAMDANVLKVTTVGFPAPADENNLTALEITHARLNAKARNTLLRSLNKENFNQVRSETKAHQMWVKLVEIHMGSKDAREERQKVLMDKINAFKKFPDECACSMYSHLMFL